MKRTKCDRCGAEQAGPMPITINWDCGMAAYDYDLCEKCGGDLDNFLKAKAPENLGPMPEQAGPSTCWGIRIDGRCDAHPFGCPTVPA